MRSTFLVLLLSVAVGGVWLAKSQPGAAPTPAAEQSPARNSAVSEHDWAKHALDRTAELKQQIARQRQEDDVK